MTYAVYIGIGLLAGGLIGCLLTIVYFKNKHSDALHKADSAEAIEKELRARIRETEEKLETLRGELTTERDARVTAEIQLQEANQRIDKEKRLIEEAKNQLTNTFKALAGDTLENSNKTFLTLAKETFNNILTESKGDLGKRQEAIDGLVKPLAESLKQFEGQINTLETKRHGAYKSLEEQIKTLATTQQQLQKETGNLVTALRKPQVRGRWGEMTLKRVVEIAGMSEHCDFTEQVSVVTDDTRSRPDMVVSLPNERKIVIDAKVPLIAYLDALEAKSEEDREKILKKHAQQLRAHMIHLGAKKYWQQLGLTPEFVVLFIPAESFFATAVNRDHDLIEDGMQRHVILATPTTLIALLHSVAYGWRQEQIVENTQKISRLGKELYERMRVLSEHLKDTGKGLEKANKAYNKAVGSLEQRVFPSARKFKELGSVSGDDIRILEPIETSPRTVNVPELEFKAGKRKAVDF